MQTLPSSKKKYFSVSGGTWKFVKCDVRNTSKMNKCFIPSKFSFLSLVTKSTLIKFSNTLMDGL